MDELSLDLNKRYSFADYLTWIDDKRRELFDGFIKMMTPAPSAYHQEVMLEIAGKFRNYLKKKSCKAFPAPFDVRLPENNKTSDEDIFTIVQPDISVVCDLSKIEKRGCLGAPDLIVEVVSLNSKRDVEDKFKLYEKHEVREYWIVYPYQKTIHVYILENKKFVQKGIYAETGKVKVNIFDDFYIDLEDVFEDAKDYENL